MKLSLSGLIASIWADTAHGHVGAILIAKVDKRATGSVTYTTVDGKNYTINDLTTGVIHFENNSSCTVFLYTDDIYKDIVDTVDVGATWDDRGIVAGSFRLGSTQ